MIGVIAAPVVTAIGALAGVVANFKIEIIKSDQSEEAVFTDIVDNEKKSD